MRDAIHWLPRKMLTEHFETRTVYVKHWFTPLVGFCLASDTFFSAPAFVMRRGKRIKGFVTANDDFGMFFVAYKPRQN